MPVNPEIPGFGLPANIKQLFDEVDTVSRAHVCQGIVTCMVANQVVEVFAAPEQKI